MKKSQINVEIEPGLKERVKVRAAQEGKSLRDLVESGLRLVLASPVLRTGSVGAVTPEQPPAAERGASAAIEVGTCEGCSAKRVRLQWTSDDVGLCAECFAEVPVTGPKGVVKPTKAELQALIDAVPAQRHELMVRVNGPSYGVTPEEVREAERQRIARQDHLRTHPEDDSQDPDVNF